jgi:hypothetical protein
MFQDGNLSRFRYGKSRVITGRKSVLTVRHIPAMFGDRQCRGFRVA